MSKQPNIILIMTDQQRYDSIAHLGFDYMITPNLDRLAREGTVFTNCFCTAPSCVPSRASFFNGRFPGRLGVYRNGDRWGHSWVESLNEAGYYCVNVGKMHTVPVNEPCGFHQRYIVENKDRGAGKSLTRFNDEWNKFLLYNNVKPPSRIDYKSHPLYGTALGAYEWELGEQYHPDSFTGTLARSVVEQYDGDRPLFLQIGFPGPHPPYDPDPAYVDMYKDRLIPVSPATREEMRAQPKCQQIYRESMMNDNHDAVKWSDNPSKEQLERLRRFYAANITMIDRQIGSIIDALDRKGLLDNAMIFFTSDHGDCLGDHGHIQKWTMYDSVVKIPAILWHSGKGVFSGRRCDALLEQFDIARLMLELAGVRIDPLAQSISIKDDFLSGRDAGRKYVYAEHAFCNVMRGDGFVSMVRSEDYKLVHYVDDEYGELYDLKNDPRECSNLWNDPAYDSVKQSLISALLRYKCSQPSACVTMQK